MKRLFLSKLQQRAIHYFLENQTVDGLVLDRQRNFDPLTSTGWCSLSATGMGLIALALASAKPFRLLSVSDASARVRRALITALDRLEHTHGILPHFVEADSLRAVGHDQRSTIDSSWLITGGLWAAEFLQDTQLQDLAGQLFERIDWGFWTTPACSATPALIRHGADGKGAALPCAWDRLNGETIHLYVLAAGSASGRCWAGANWSRLDRSLGTAAGRRFLSADLGLFVFQYGFDLIDLSGWCEPQGLDLAAQASLAAEANFWTCRAAAGQFRTYHYYWGLSAGDGPGESLACDVYRCYAPGQPLDGTAHLTASLASIGSQPGLVLDNLMRAHQEAAPCPLGRYGFSSLNLDRCWVSRDMVGIDAGAAILALDNFLHGNRVRQAFHRLQAVQRGLERIGFTLAPASKSVPVQASLPIAS
jgi:hypothetical protein